MVVVKRSGCRGGRLCLLVLMLVLVLVLLVLFVTYHGVCTPHHHEHHPQNHIITDMINHCAMAQRTPHHLQR